MTIAAGLRVSATVRRTLGPSVVEAAVARLSDSSRCLVCRRAAGEGQPALLAQRIGSTVLATLTHHSCRSSRLLNSNAAILALEHRHAYKPTYITPADTAAQLPADRVPVWVPNGNDEPALLLNPSPDTVVLDIQTGGVVDAVANSYMPNQAADSSWMCTLRADQVLLLGPHQLRVEFDAAPYFAAGLSVAARLHVLVTTQLNPEDLRDTWAPVREAADKGAIVRHAVAVAVTNN